MIGSIDKSWDVNLFLTKKEVKQLKEVTLEGILVKLDIPKIQSPVIISVNKDPKNYIVNASGAQLTEWKDDRYIFLISEITHKIIETGSGVIEWRYTGGLDGSKFRIVNTGKYKELNHLRGQISWYVKNL
jgi:hypothetical protein